MAAEPCRLKLFWEHFFKAETGTYEKSTWLDLFLAEFIVQLNEGADAKELIDFCPVSGVVSLVGCELLCGVHRATAAPHTHPPPLAATVDTQPSTAPTHPPPIHQAKDKSNDEAEANVEQHEHREPAGALSLSLSLSAPSESALRRHLLSSSAWRCLVLLRALGVEGLSCCRQLSSVLVWAYGELQGPAGHGAVTGATLAPRPPPRPLHTMFSDRIWSTQKNLASRSPKPPSVSTPNKNVTVGRWKKVDTPEKKTKSKYGKESELSSDSGGSGSDLQALNRTRTAASTAVAAVSRDAFQYFDAPAPAFAPSSASLRDTYDCKRLKAADFTTERHRLVMDTQISAGELALIITDLLAELCRTESSLSGAQGQQISVQCVNFALRNLCALQFASAPAHAPPAATLPLTELLVVALDKVLVHPDLCAKLINAGILPMLLRILEDVVCKSKHNFGSTLDSNRAKSDPQPGIESEHLLKFVFGIAYSITAFFHCLLMQCRSLDKLQEFTDQFKLYAECLKGGLLKESVELMIRLPDERGEGVTLVKRLIDAMGRLVGGMKRVRSDVVHAAACARARHKACRARLRAGRHHHHPALGAPLTPASAAPALGSACCVAVLYGSLTGLLADERVGAEPALRARLLGVMLECGSCCCFSAGYLVECVVRLVLAHGCAAAAGLRLLEHAVYGELGAGVVPPRPDALPCAVCAPPSSTPAPATAAAWPFLVHYNSLLQPDNHGGVLQATVGHLLRVTPRCRPEVKYELLFGVVYPTFIVAKHRYVVRGDEASFFLTAACLNVFAGMLAVAPFAERFVQRGGLTYVLELVSLPEFSGQCCAILEMAIAVEIERLGEGGAGAESLGSVQMLFRALEEATDKCFSVYRLLLGEKVFEELYEPREGEGAPPTREEGTGALEESVDDYLEVVRTAVTFWDTCGCLAWRCVALRGCVAPRVGLALSLLRVALARGAGPTPPGDAPQPHAQRLHLRLAAALLTVLFALDEHTLGASVSAACAALRAAARGGAAAALCEAALAVPVTHTHAPAAHKLPVLWCASGGSSASGDSARPPPPPPTDAGYEADVEIGKLELSSSLKSRQRSSLDSSDSISSEERESGSPCVECGARGEGPRPQLCLIVLDILVQLIDRVCPVMGPGADAASAAGAVRGVCARLAAARAPLLAPLLAPPVLRLLAAHTTDTHLQEIQRSVLELVERCATRGVEPAPLAALLRLAGGGVPATLAALRRLARAARAQPHTPDWALTFPILLHDKESQATEEKETGEASGSANSAAGEAWAAQLADAHRANGVSSSWARCAARLAVDAEWAVWLHGWAALMWLRTHHHHKEDGESNGDAEPGEALHVLSLGHDALMLEMWLHAHTGHVEFRLSRAEGGSGGVGGAGGVGGVVATARGGRPLPSRRWTCVGLKVRDVQRGRKNYIQVTLFVNGCEHETFALPLQGLIVRKPSRVHLLLGAASSGAGAGAVQGVYHMAALRITRAPLLTQPLALHLAAHGPDYACQVKCEYPNYSVVMTPEVLESGIDWDQVYDLSSAALREFHDSVVLAFSAHAPQRANLYHLVPTMATVFSGRGAGGAGVPEPVCVRWAGAPSGSLHRGLAPALLMLGGVDVLLFLFARVVEMGDGHAQATALSALLCAGGADGRLHAALHCARHTAMLLAALHAPSAMLTHMMLKVIIDAACSGPVLTGGECGGGREGTTLVVCAGAALLEPRMLLLLLDGFKHAGVAHTEEQELSWEVDTGGVRVRERGCVWALSLRCVAALAHGSHNLRQLARVGLLAHLLTACKERLLGGGSMCGAGAAALAALVRALLAAPPPAAGLADLTDFLLLLHQASDTFITHSRANFYFLLTADTAESSEYVAPDTKRRTRQTRPRPSSPAASSSSFTSDQGTSDDVTSEHEDKVDNSSVDSAKHLKGLINMQIKEGRKHNISSTSENSDVTAERPKSTELAEGGEGELAGFVVVGKSLPPQYHDRGKKESTSSSSGAGAGTGAGAESDGRAEVCRGLLLLLRDAIATLPDSQLAVSGQVAVSDAGLCVLSNQRSGDVRAAAVRAAAAAQRRHLLPRDKHYYMHLANQVALYPCTWELAGACAALLTKCDVPLLDQLDADIWADVGSEAGARAPPLLALLPAALHDPPLAAAIASLIATLIDKVPLKSLLEVCVGEVLVRTVRGVGAVGMAAGEGGGLGATVHDALARLARKALATPHSMQTVVELHHMLTYVEQTTSNEGSARAARDAQAALYVAELDYLEEKLHCSYTAHTKYANYFATVLSSAVSLGSANEGCAARLAGAAARATAFLLTLPPHGDALREAHLFDRLLATLLPAASSSQPPKWWAGAGVGAGGAGALWAAPLTELVWWAAGPARTARPLQARLLRALYHAPPPAQRLLTPHDPSALQKLSVYLLTMLKQLHAAAAAGGQGCGVELAISDWARSWAVSCQAALAERLPAARLAAEADALLRQDLQRWAKAAHKQRPAIAKVIFSRDALAAKLTEGAMSLTRAAVDAQNAQRKLFMERLRAQQGEAAACAQRWQRLADHFTHEQALWHDPSTYPQSWQLDPTEGPGRVRVRLRRAHLNIPPRFLKPHARYKAERAAAALAAGGGGSASGSAGGAGWARERAARLQPHEAVVYMARATHVTVDCETPGELLLTDRSIHFVPETTNGESFWWRLSALEGASARRWCLQERAVELQPAAAPAQLLAFADTNERDAFLKALANCHLPNRVEPDTLTEAMSQWRAGSISNWEYLMRLNSLAGRTYNDLMQYPVMPFVIADYTSRILDLNDPASFRDLSRPMAIQDKSREQHYIKTYNDLRMARREGCSPLLARSPHHYASLYSNSGGVLHYLVRLPPFTQLFLNYQDNNFDMPDRTFHSLATTWRLITHDSPTDVKELIPELFYLPELFYNNEELELGVRQCGADVDAVALPPWAADARLFTLAHRQALEAAVVTDHLPHWIDLVFGYKQTGQAAIDAINVFPACTYYGFEPMALADEVDRRAAAAMVRTYGQAPRQLLRHPHPHRTADLRAPVHQQREVWAGVAGGRWGSWAGAPGVSLRASASVRAPGAHRLQPLAARAAAVLATHTLLLTLQDEAESLSGGGAALVSWGHGDGLLRLWRRRDLRPDLLLHVPALDQITKGVSWGRSEALLGLASGCVLVLHVSADAGGVRVRVQELRAHAAAITDVCVCAPAGLLATASDDGRIVLWDLNKFSYIRTLPNRDMLSVTLLAVSETLGDVASVHDPARRGSSAPTTPDADEDSYEKDAYKYKSLIRVHTCNGRFVGSVKVQSLVTCVCYSVAAEGVSVNCVAAGLQDGGVTLYCAWDLRPVRRLPPPAHSPANLLSLSYSSDASVLFACYADGWCVAWEGSEGEARAPPRLQWAHALLPAARR